MKIKLLLVSIVLLLGMSCLVASAKKIAAQEFPLPGETIANIKLQYDTYMPVTVVANSKVKGCQPSKIRVINSKVTKEPYNLKEENGVYVSGQWLEEWTVNACGKTVYIPVKFVLDASGATYVISGSEAHF